MLIHEYQDVYCSSCPFVSSDCTFLGCHVLHQNISLWSLFGGFLCKISLLCMLDKLLATAGVLIIQSLLFNTLQTGAVTSWQFNMWKIIHSLLIDWLIKHNNNKKGICFPLPIYHVEHYWYHYTHISCHMMLLYLQGRQHWIVNIAFIGKLLLISDFLATFPSNSYGKHLISIIWFLFCFVFIFSSK